MTRSAKLHVAVVAALAVVIAAVVAITLRAKKKKALPPQPNETVVVVPHVVGAITLDGDLDDSGWLGPLAHSGPFVDKNGDIAKPFSEARVTWGDGVLYVSLYAADEDIRAKAEAESDVKNDDSFHLVLDDGTNERIFDVGANAAMADATRPSRFAKPGERPPPDPSWSSGAHASREIDGTPNQPADMDEEWAVEMAIPLESLGLEGKAGERLLVAAHRCDTTKNGQRSCGSWGERAPLVLVLQ